MNSVSIKRQDKRSIKDRRLMWQAHRLAKEMHRIELRRALRSAILDALPHIPPDEILTLVRSLSEQRK